MDKKIKTIIIIAVVVAVAAYLFWKRGKGNAAVKGGTAGGDDDTVPTTNELTEDQIIARLTSCPADNKKYLRSEVAKINANDAWKRSVQEKASNNGTTYPKQGVMDASWVVYRTGANATEGWAKYIHEKICAEVQAM